MPAEKIKLALYSFVFVFIVEFFYILHGFGDFYQLNGDSLCQIAYWKILFRPWLTGGIGASVAKPGQIVIFGALHQYFNDTALRIVLAFFGAGLSLTLGTIAAGIGGAAAGACSILLSIGAFSEFVQSGDSNLFLVPLLLGGLNLYYYSESGAKKLGLFFLALTPLFRIEAAFAVGLVLLVHLVKKEWKEFAAGSFALALSLGVWAKFLFRIQGEVPRFMSAAAAGYAAEPKARLLASLVSDLKGAFFYYSTFLYLLLLITGILGICLHFPKYRGYLTALGPVIVVFINYTFLGGSLSTRYFETAFALGISSGVGVLFALSRRPLPLLPCKLRIVLAPALLLLAAALCYLPLIKRLVTPLPPAPLQIADGLELSREKLIPEGSRILSEDDVLYVLMMNEPDRFKRVESLQMFNVADDRRRASILANTDYIYMLKGTFRWYYLHANPAADGRDPAPDLFNGFVREIIRSNSRTGIYGVTLTPLVNDEKRLILKVERSSAKQGRS